MHSHHDFGILKGRGRIPALDSPSSRTERENGDAEKSLHFRRRYARRCLGERRRSRHAVPSAARFSITYTFATSKPAQPIDIGGGRDLTANEYLVTTVNNDGTGFLNLVAGHCTNVRFTVRETGTVDTKAYCNFRDRDHDTLYAEYTTGTPKPSHAISNQWTFVSGTGKYFGVWGQAEDTNSNNLSVQGSYQAVGELVGFYTFVRPHAAADEGGGD